MTLIITYLLSHDNTLSVTHLMVFLMYQFLTFYLIYCVMI